MINEQTPCPFDFPDHVWEGTRNYILHGAPTGDFLAAVLSNDLFDAFGRADMRSAAGMQGIVMFLYNESPSSCHGSREKVEAWIASGGLLGIR